MLGRNKAKAQRVPLSELDISVNSISKASKKVIRVLQDNNYQAYVVGGAVRDLLLGLHPRDFDVVTNATPKEIKKLFRRAWIIGRRFQLVHVKERDELVEVSTFRDKPSFLNLASNTENKFGNIDTDYQRRDVTLNALYLDPIAKEVIDYVNGIDDAHHRIMKIIGKPKVRYKQDPVRMIRILRLAAKLDCSLDEQSVEPIAKYAPLLDDISHARLAEEFIKVISSGASVQAYKYLQKHQIFPRLFPHLAKPNEEATQFIELALLHNDSLVNRFERNSLSFLVGALYWPQVSKQWQDACAQRKQNMFLMHELFHQSGINDNRILTHNLRAHTKRIWELQVRFQRQYRKAKALRIKIDDFGTKKALAFLQLRYEHGEIDAEIAEWWRSFSEADIDERKKMVISRPRKRKKSSARPNSETQSSS